MVLPYGDGAATRSVSLSIGARRNDLPQRQPARLLGVEIEPKAFLIQKLSESENARKILKPRPNALDLAHIVGKCGREHASKPTG
jgi:hypothetical protein